MTVAERTLWAIIAVMLGPAIGLGAMLAASEQLESAWKGGWDWGVLLAGSALAAGVTFAFGALADAPRKAQLKWSVATLLITATAAVASILALAWLMGPFAAMD